MTRYDAFQFRGVSGSPMADGLSLRMVGEIGSKALIRWRRMRMMKRPESTAMIIGDFNENGFCNFLPSVRLPGLFDTLSLPFFDCHNK